MSTKIKTDEVTEIPEASWAFILNNRGIIRGMAGRQAKLMVAKRQIAADTADEFIQDAIIYIAARAHRFDESKGRPSTWIGWQVYAVYKSWMKTVDRDVGYLALTLVEDETVKSAGCVCLAIIPHAPWGSTLVDHAHTMTYDAAAQRAFNRSTPHA